MDGSIMIPPRRILHANEEVLLMLAGRISALCAIKALRDQVHTSCTSLCTRASAVCALYLTLSVSGADLV